MQRRLYRPLPLPSFRKSPVRSVPFRNCPSADVPHRSQSAFRPVHPSDLCLRPQYHSYRFHCLMHSAVRRMHLMYLMYCLHPYCPYRFLPYLIRFPCQYLQSGCFRFHPPHLLHLLRPLPADPLHAFRSHLQPAYPAPHPLSVYLPYLP